MSDSVYLVLLNWSKALHIIGVLALMAGIMMLPRLMVYYVEGEGEEIKTKMLEAAHRLNRIILLPALGLSWAAGLTLLVLQWGSLSLAPWFWVKLLCVLAISGFHGVLSGWISKARQGVLQISPKRLRVLNEVPFLLAVLVVILVIIEPGGRL